MTEFGSLQVHIGYLIFSSKKTWPTINVIFDV